MNNPTFEQQQRAAIIELQSVLKRYIPAAQLQQAVLGVMADIDDEATPADTVLLHTPLMTMTVGELRSLPEWKADEAIVREIVAATVGRAAKMVLLSIGINIATIPISIVAEILQATDEVEAEVVAAILGSTTSGAVIH